MSKLAVRKNEKGRGLYAREPFRKGETVTVDHVIVFPNKDAGKLIHKYTFAWTQRSSALALGPGSLMNHSFEPNVVYRKDTEAMVVRFRTLRDVVKDEELLINYNGDPDDKTAVRFG